MASCVPRGGDIWLTLNPQAGHEQAGRRPDFVVSPHPYNKNGGLVLACPITSQIKGYPFEVRVISKSGINGAIGADQVKSMDWKARKAEFVEAAEKNLV